MRISCMILLVITAIVCGCAPAQIQHAPLYLSQTYNDNIRKEIHVLPIIDARTGNNENRYDFSVPGLVRVVLEDKGYIVSELEINVKKCTSVADIRSARDLACLSAADLSNKDIILIFSVDDYTPPATWGFTGMAFVSGVLFDMRSDTIMWKDSIKQGSDGEAYVASMYGGGGYLGGMLVKALAPNIIFRNAAYASIGAIVKTIPQNPNPIYPKRAGSDMSM